ncbi:MAG: DNA replication and repair protein RecF [Treponema sp.]|nr:DNA replication and repair protein RecF [Treponema sp.]
MGFAFVRTVSFRNLADTEVDVRGKDVFLAGKNGQGKTNFIESLYFCSYASSFRGVKDKELVRNGEKDCSVAVSLDTSLYSKVSVQIKDGKKVITLDGNHLEDRKELLSVAPVIIFCHEDMEFAAGTPERRRWFFDQTRSIWDSLYLDDLRKYRHVLKTRNSLFRKNGNTRPGPEIFAMLDALDPQLAHYGLELKRKRQETAEEFSLIFEPLYREISGIAGIGVTYIPSWKGDDVSSITAQLCGRREADISFGASLSGPHRDRYLFTKEGEDFSARASTGQRRLLSLLLRVAQAKVFSEKTGKRPVLLLDDVLLELDREKRRNFLLAMPEYEQAFYTFLPGEYDNYRKSDTIVYRIESGQVKHEKSW